MDGERYFYHSFPRRGTDDIQKGLAILSSILDRGLLLTPEIIEFKEMLENGLYSKPWKMYQKRICFTELNPSELRQHSAKFGSFALEWEIGALRSLGAIPVFYVPLDGWGAAILSRLGEVQRVLTTISDLKTLCSDESGDDKFLSMVINEEKSRTRCTIGGLKDLISLIENETQGSHHLLASIRAVCGFFYPVENLQYTGELAYYRQREWRIIGNMVSFGLELTEKPSEEEIATLVELDKRFFGREMDSPTGRYKMAEQCQFYRRSNAGHVVESLNRIITPSDSIKYVENLLEERSIKVSVVSVEDI